MKAENATFQGTKSGHDGPSGSLGAYLPAKGNYEFTNCNFEGDTALELRAGNLTINGGKFVARGKPEATSTAHGNGSTTFGAAVAIAQHTTQLPIKVEINGGTFEGYTPFYQANPEENPQDALDRIELKINGGTFTPTNGGTQAVYSQNFKGFIAGGTFNDAAQAADYMAVAKVGDKLYGDLQKAFSEAEDGATVVLLKDVEINATVEVKKNLTLNLNGKTITNTNEHGWAFMLQNPVTFKVDGTKE